MVDAARRAGSELPEPIADFAIDAFDAEDLLDRVPRPMSTGERQLCALLITLSAPVSALALVDPTAGLDARRRRAVVELLIDLAQDRPVWVASDDPGFDLVRPWKPIDLDELVGVFDGAAFDWWVTGGHALELHLGTSWRGHADTDVSVRRADTTSLRTHLADWDAQVAAAGVLRPWAGEELTADRSQNNLWWRRSPGAPFCLDVVISEGDERDWIYRRDPQIRRPWNEAVLVSAAGVPYLAPELQLLFKSHNPRPKDTEDANQVLPRLDPPRRAWLAHRLAPAHEWHDLAGM